MADTDSLWFCLTARSYDEVRRNLSKKKRSTSTGNATPETLGLHEEIARYYQQASETIEAAASSNRRIVLLTLLLVLGTFFQNYLTQRSIKETQREFAVSERPWIGLTTTEPIFLANTQTVARVQTVYINAGKTTALRVRPMIRLRTGDPIPTNKGYLDVAGPVIFECADDNVELVKPAGVVLVPNVPHQDVVAPEDDVALHEQEIAANTLGLYLTGCIDYEDGLGLGWHRTHICKYWSHMNPIFVSCSKGGRQDF